MAFLKKNKNEKSPGEFQKEVEQFSKDAFYLFERIDGTGFSKIGGIPVVPEGFEWPTWNGKPLAFLMQLKFSEINGGGQISYLPASGLLYVFYDQEQSTWGFDPKDAGSWRVFYSAEDVELKQGKYPSNIKERYHEKLLASKIVKTYPAWDDANIMALNLTDEQEDWYCEFRNAFLDDAPGHQLGGWPNPIQGSDMDLECELVSNGLYCGDETGYNDPRAKALEQNKDEWILILQIDSDDDAGMMWGDLGTLYFWIKKKDLGELNFHNVWMILQCG